MVGYDSGLVGHDSGLIGHDSGLVGYDSGSVGSDSGLVGYDNGLVEYDQVAWDSSLTDTEGDKVNIIKDTCLHWRFAIDINANATGGVVKGSTTSFLRLDLELVQAPRYRIYMVGRGGPNTIRDNVFLLLCLDFVCVFWNSF